MTAADWPDSPASLKVGDVFMSRWDGPERKTVSAIRPAAEGLWITIREKPGERLYEPDEEIRIIRRARA